MARNRKRRSERRPHSAPEDGQPRPGVATARPRDEAPAPLDQAAPDAELASAQAAGATREDAPGADPLDDDGYETGEDRDDEDGLYDELGYDAEPGEQDPSVAEGAGGGGGPGRNARRRRGGGGDGSGGELTPSSSAAHPARPGAGVRLVRFLQGSWRELQRVQWPDRPQVVQATGVVIGFVIVAGAFLAGGDWVAQRIVNFILP